MTACIEKGAGAGKLSIAFFGHDWSESTVIKRATALMEHGAEVTGFMFHRVRRRPARRPNWENFDLGVTEDRNYLRRLPRLLLGVVKALRNRSILRRSHVFYARNIDMLFVAAMAKLLSRSRAMVVYEALDVQPVFIGQRPVSRLFRWLERRLLSVCELLVVSAPDHMTEYFHGIQGYRGPWRLIENKVGAHPALCAAAGTWPELPAGPPWIIGYFGVLRCVRSLEILQRVAEALPDHVVVHLRGQASETDIPQRQLEEIAVRHPNIKFGGPYSNPHDLGAIYSQIHFTWAIDYIAAQSNSRWSLLNRFYEGGLFGAVALGRTDTATGRLIEQTGFGWTVPEPLETTVIDFLRRLEPDTYAQMRARLVRAPRAMFVDETDTRDLVRSLEAQVGARLKPTNPLTPLWSCTYDSE